MPTQLDHVVVYGQSLAAGASTGTSIATPAALDANNLMLGASARQRAGGDNENVLNGAALVSFSALKEEHSSAVGVGSVNETICSGLAYWLRGQFGGADPKLLLHSSARPGYKIEQLEKGTQPYTNLITAVSRARLIALAAGYTYRVPCIVWLQGESDEIFGTTAPYAAKLNQLQADLEADINAVTGRADTIPLFIEQFSSFWYMKMIGAAPGYPPMPPGIPFPGLPEMPGILLDVHEGNPNIRIAGPTYNFTWPFYPSPLQTTQDIHLSPHQYRWMGEHYAHVIYQHIYQGRAWECLRPVSAVRNAHIIDLAFTGLDGILTADVADVASAGHLGFSVTVDDRLVRLTSAKITGDATARLILATPAPAGVTKVWYGFPLWNANSLQGARLGPRGNLRDSISFGSRLGYGNIHKWAVHFSKEATNA